MPAQFLFRGGDRDDLTDVFHPSRLGQWNAPRIAFIGRSNVGKSSLINALTKSKLAQVSSTPGKTRAFFFYHLPEKKKILVDLPGYGFAKVAPKERQTWAKKIETYLKADLKLERLFILLDSRHGPTPVDEEAIAFLGKFGIPMTWVMTKTDSLKTQTLKNERQRAVAQAAEEVVYPPDTIHWVSVKSKAGISELFHDHI